MIPSVRYYLRFIDAEEKIKAFGFEKKVRILGLLKLRHSKLLYSQELPSSSTSSNKKDTATLLPSGQMLTLGTFHEPTSTRSYSGTLQSLAPKSLSGRG
jgi:hypothetical protein